MSQKITAKNLTYDTSLPPFLARLRGQQTTRSGPDPILAAHRRPGQKRSASEEAEDGPVVVDEDGNVVDLNGELPDGEGNSAGGEKGEAGEENNQEKKNNEEKDPAPGKDKEKVAGIGASRKRKVGRIIGEEQLDSEGDVVKTRKDSNDEARIAKASADVRRLLHQDADTTSSQGNGTPANPSRSSEAADDKSRKEQGSRQNEPSQKIVKSTKKKPAKKIKLSFGDDDGE